MVSSMAAVLFLLEPKCLECGMIIEAAEIVFYYSMDQQKNKLFWYYSETVL